MVGERGLPRIPDIQFSKRMHVAAVGWTSDVRVRDGLRRQGLDLKKGRVREAIRDAKDARALHESEIASDY